MMIALEVCVLEYTCPVYSAPNEKARTMRSAALQPEPFGRGGR